ncbi:MAG: site-specific integrase [Opitutae bacterium]|nr:site-specific integrase [Opitutae bacterium]
MAATSSFKIVRFKNSNGTTSWRVSGWLAGTRIRKNFKLREEAATEKATLEIQALQKGSGLQTVATSLSIEQVREAEAIFRRLTGHHHPLTFYLDFALSNYREPLTSKLLTDAVRDYKAAKEHEHQQDLISAMHVTRIKREMDRLVKHFPNVTMAEITGARLRDYLELDRVGHKTYNNRRGHVGTFLKFALERDWIVENPMQRISARRLRKRRYGAVTLSAQQATGMMAFVEQEHPAAVPFFALCLFAGIRPCVRSGEILRLRPEHIRIDSDIVRIDGEVSKVREPRSISIQPNLAAWLKTYPLEKFPIIPTNLQHIREKVVEKFSLSHDVMRHTFISMFVAKFRSIGEAALQAGNSESIIRKHYLDLKSKEEAEAFFRIMPKRSIAENAAATPAPALPFPSDTLRKAG